MKKTAPPTVLFVKPGASLKHKGREYVILHIVDLKTVLAREPSSGERVILQISDIGQSIEDQEAIPKCPITTHSQDLLEISDHDWSLAETWRKAIAPLLDKRSTLAEYTQVANQMGVSVATLYRRVANFKRTRQLTALLPTVRPGGRGKGRISADVEVIIRDCIDKYYLTDQRRTKSATIKEIRRLCTNASLAVPSHLTILKRLDWIDETTRVKRREGNKAARQYKPFVSPIPDVHWPLSLVQIDHTKLPVMIVDDVHRKPIARAWITVAIDAFSRVCLGQYLSLEAPSAMSAGLCVVHAILPKEKWLHKKGIEGVEWPFFGVMDVLHMDNAREFRGEMLKFACREYDIDPHFRPVKVPEYGAYIERYMGTISEALKAVGGSTFSGPKEKGEYDAEGNACLTFDELEKWLILLFAEYHLRVHSGLGTTPAAKWREGIIGTKTQRGRGLPALRLDEEKLRIDFMPFEERCIYDYGVVIDQVHYFHDALRPWMNAKDPDHPRHGRKFRFRRDPRDISEVYFFDPDLKRYVRIPYRDTSLPPTSIWEYRATQELAKSQGIKVSNEREVFALLTKRRELEDAAALKTKSARQAQQRRKQHTKAKTEKAVELPKVTQDVPSSAPPPKRGYDPSKVKPLEDDY